MSIGRSLALCLLVGWAPSGLACSLVYRGMEVELPDALRQSEEAFVATLSDYELEPPQEGGQYYLAKIRYALVETIKGRPDAVGELVEHTPYPAVDGALPVPACGPWVAKAGSEGATYLIFASRYEGLGRPLPHPFSLRLDAQNLDREKWLDLIRTTEGNQKIP